MGCARIVVEKNFRFFSKTLGQSAHRRSLFLCFCQARHPTLRQTGPVRTGMRTTDNSLVPKNKYSFNHVDAVAIAACCDKVLGGINYPSSRPGCEIFTRHHCVGWRKIKFMASRCVLVELLYTPYFHNSLPLTMQNITLLASICGALHVSF